MHTIHGPADVTFAYICTDLHMHRVSAGQSGSQPAADKVVTCYTNTRTALPIWSPCQGRSLWSAMHYCFYINLLLYVSTSWKSFHIV